MTKFIVIPIVLSLLGHGVFFSVFRGTSIYEKIMTIPKLYLISSGQIEHEMTSNIILTPLDPTLMQKNSIWADKLYMTQDLPYDFVRGQSGLEESVSVIIKKVDTLRKLPVLERAEHIPSEKALPRFSDLFYHKLPDRIIKVHGERIIKLGEDKQLAYYIQGPVSDRNLRIPNFSLEVENIPVELKFRVWVSKNGRVNQVIVEEGSGFPVMDRRLVDTIKEWRFQPVYDPSAPKYQWGIIKIRIQG